MTLVGRGRFDVAAVRRDHPIEAVVSASGVALTQRGRGFMGCCPFHDDSTASLSVGGIPDRFHCFGCGLSGDVRGAIGYGCDQTGSDSSFEQRLT